MRDTACSRKTNIELGGDRSGRDVPRAMAKSNRLSRVRDNTPIMTSDSKPSGSSPTPAPGARVWRRVPAGGPAPATQGNRGQPRAGLATDVRLSKRMADLGMASRREADAWIERGWVEIGGSTAVLGTKVPTDLPRERIRVQRAAREEQQHRVTILLNKPVGYVSGQAEDGHQPAVVLITPANRWSGDPVRQRFSGAQLRGLAPAGRLDIDSTGLLVLTQDGRVARQLIGEDSTLDKEYLVRVADEQGPGDVRARLPADKLRLLNHGLSLDGQVLKPAQVEWLNADQLRFVLVEGKKRQIRRMCEQVGLTVVGLKRVRMGHVRLGALPQGQWRYLDERERF